MILMKCFFFFIKSLEYNPAVTLDWLSTQVPRNKLVSKITIHKNQFDVLYEMYFYKAIF